MISGKTTLIAHIGYPIDAFKAPMIYNPYFEQTGIDAVVVPMGVKGEDYAGLLRGLFRMTNIRGALVTMPHKVTTVALLDEVTPTVKIAGSCNAILKRPDGTLLGDMFDGAGFVRGARRKGARLDGATVLVVGSGGVGSAIAASLAARDRRDARVVTGLMPAASAEADALLARVGITDLADTHCAALAYGDAKRVELTMALAGNPRLLLMDEPTAGMAPQSRRELMQLATGLVRRGEVAMVFTEHDMDIVFEFADRIIVLDHGRAIAQGAPAAIRADPRVRAVYLGDDLPA